ncbi:hypothetical protein DFJ58DRAFT_737237 [Suillus subalutaceus]|uniref:uncharacterized protein n=1 Tax=Suillus subalutaceus TaxID=48586 RepID=UPI001B867117|nr:uncharacterized protein DFJ58DRAFT_737237 [Suillus subalutaceus]KAG1829716.1 hypothetical protein DFJ58DRAFT_737237 [Suillus subalutaceus]
MAAFLHKTPSVITRVLDVNDCPPLHVLHSPADFPLYYDPLYHPECHPAVFETPSGFCSWLYSALNYHVLSCAKCASCIEVHSVSFDGVAVNIRIGGVSVSFSPSHFAPASYAHCSVFRCYEGCRAAVTMESCLLLKFKRDPPWFFHAVDIYRDNLSEVPAADLRDIARRLGFTKSQYAVQSRRRFEWKTLAPVIFQPV